MTTESTRGCGTDESASDDSAIVTETMAHNGQEQGTILTEIQTALQHTFVYGLGNVLAKALGFLMLPFYTRYLAPVDYGILEVLDLSMALFGMILNMGITTGFQRCYSSAETVAEKRKAASTAFLFVAITGVLTFCAGLAVLRPASVLLFGPDIPVTYLALSFGSLVLAYIGNLPRTYLLARQSSGTYTLVDTITIVSMLGLNIYFIAVLKIGLIGILLSSIIVGALQVVVLSGWILREAGIGFSGSQLRHIIAFGLPLVFSNIALFSLNFSDRMFLQHYRSLEVVGIYAVGYKFGFMLNYLFVQPFYLMWQSRIYLIHARPDHPKIFGQMFVLYSTLLLYAALALSMLSPEIVLIMTGPQFAASASVIPLIALSYVFFGIGDFAQAGMFLTNKTSMIGILSAVAAVLNIVLNHFLILHYGMMGAAFATLVSFMVIAGASYWCSQRVFPLPLGAARVAQTMLLCIGLYALSCVWTPGSLLLGLVLKICLLIAFPILLWRARILSRAEMGTVASSMDRAKLVLSRVMGLLSARFASP